MSRKNESVFRPVLVDAGGKQHFEYGLTLLKALPRKMRDGSEVQPVYRKVDFKKPPVYPYMHKAVMHSVATFKELYHVYEKLIDKAAWGQVFGVPPADVVAGGLPTKRTISVFSYHDHDTGHPVMYNYVAFEIDCDDERALSDKYRLSYRSKCLTPAVLEYEARRFIRTILSDPPQDEICETIPMIVRLSGSFGKSETPSYRAHVIVPTELFSPPALGIVATDLSPYLDSSIYKSPNHVFFSCAPAFNEQTDPVRNVGEDLRRIYLFDPKELSEKPETTPQIDLTRVIKKAIQSSGKQKQLDYVSGKRATDDRPNAWDLPGDIGVFNRFARFASSNFSIERWLEMNGYDRVHEFRWRSPSSTSDSAGVVIYPGGYVYDYHSNSPIKEIIPYPDRPLSAYDLYYHLYVNRGEKKRFKEILYKLRANDPQHKSAEYKKIEESLTFVTPGLDKSEIRACVSGLVERIFSSRIDTREKEELFDRIIEATKKTDAPYNKKLLSKMWSELVVDLQEELGNIDPKNPDDVNADAFIKKVKIYYEPNGDRILIEDPVFPRIISPNKDELETILDAYIDKLSTSRGWQHPKISSTMKMIVRRVKSMTRQKTLKTPGFLPHMFLFKDSYESIDIYTKDIMTVPQSQFVECVLPFTKEQYLKQLDSPHPFWHEFLEKSIDNQETIDLLQHVYAYLFSPHRKEQKILFLFGTPRSGKSTIKNIMGQFFDNVEFSAKQIGDHFILSEMTPQTRMMVINEFNISRRLPKRIGELINLVKTISGRDPIQVRGLHESYRAFISDAMPVLISNYIPEIRDDAFQRRLIPLQFRHSQPDDNSSEFERQRNEALPTIFSWAIQVLSADNKTVNFDRFQDTDEMRRVRDYILQDVDYLRLFFRKYVKPGRLDSHRATDKSIAKYQLQAAIRAYHYKIKGFQIPDDALPNDFPSLRVIRNYFPTSVIDVGRVRIADDRHMCVTGLQWTDYDKMVRELSEFSGEFDTDDNI